MIIALAFIQPPFITKTLTAVIHCSVCGNRSEALRQAALRYPLMTTELAVLVLACAAWINRAQDHRIRFLVIHNRVLRETDAILTA